jgi:hypothetical protein
MPRDNPEREQAETNKVSQLAADPSVRAKNIINALKKLTCPAHDSVWLGPFEQLVGGGYALLAAVQHGIHRRDLNNHYNSRVQARVVSHIESFLLSAPVADPRGFEDWTSGFYFKSAIQRIVWAGERLLLTFAAVDCACGSRAREQSVSSERPRWKDILDGALHRLDHVQNDDAVSLPMCRALREQFVFRDKAGKAREYQRDDLLDPKKVLAMLRYDGNNRKHRIYVRSELRDQMSAGKGDGKKWCSSGADFQFDLAAEAFDLVCDAYEELKTWNPAPKS